MARCGCSGSSCSCLIVNGVTTTVSGTGTAVDPYIIEITVLAAPAYTTATRPSPSLSGVGTMIFDTTLNKPLWSDGNTWRDATGTAV